MLNNLETLAVDLISHAALALQHLAALSKLSRLSMPNAYHLSTMALARLTALTALNVAEPQSWVGCCTSLLLAQHKAGMCFINLAGDVQLNMSSNPCFQDS